MYPVTANFLKEISVSHTAVSKIEVVRGPAVTTFAVLGGQVILDIDSSTRRALDIEVVNTGTYTYDEMRALLDPTVSVIRAYRGVQYIDGTEEYCPLGEFYLDRLLAREHRGTPVFSVTGLDASSRCLTPMATPAMIPAGIPFHLVVPMILSKSMPTLVYNLTPVAWTCPPILMREDSIPWTEAAKAAQAGGLDLYIDRRGQCCAGVRPNDARAVADYSFVEGEGSTFWDVERDHSGEIFPNVVVVLGANQGFQDVRGEAADLDPNSRTYRFGTYGEHVKTVRSEYATNNEQAEFMARSILTKSLGPSDEVQFSALVNPALEDLDTVAFTRTVMGLSTERMLICRLEIPLSANTHMTGRARRSILIDGTGAPGRV